MAVSIEKEQVGRYRGLIISIAVFLSLIGILLAFTFYTSRLIEQDALLIDTSNEVANNGQAVIKDLFDLNASYGEDISSPHMKTVISRLEKNSNLIGERLNLIESGGSFESTDGQTYTLPAVTDAQTLADIKEAQEQWSLLEPKIRAYLENARNIQEDSSDELALAVEQAKTSSLRMNEALEALTVDIFRSAQNQSNLIRLIQLAGVAAVLAYFLIFVFFFVRRLRESDAEALAARRETQEIMQTVNTGLFLLDKDLNIGQQHSNALENIMGTQRIAGENFTNMLRGRISDKDLGTTKQFIEQLYNPRVKEKLVNDLNPLQKVMLHSDSEDTTNVSRYLDFNFSRVYEQGEISRILVNVSDVTDEVRLEQRLEQERAQNDMQIEMLTTILNVKPKVINEFIANTKVHIDKINNILKNPGSSQFELENKLKAIYREMHSLKGESSALKLHSFTKIASQAEDKLQALNNKGKLSGNDFLPLAVDLDELLNLSTTIETLGERINQTSPNHSVVDSSIKSNPVHPAQALDALSESKTSVHTIMPVSGSLDSEKSEVGSTQNDHDVDTLETMFDDFDDQLITASDEQVDDRNAFYQGFVQDIAERQNKKVRLDASEFNSNLIPNSLNTVAKDIVIQLLRNSVVHGIEAPNERVQFGKSQAGVVKLITEVDDTNRRVNLIVEDDGRGIDYDAIRQRLIDSKRVSVQKAAQLTRGQLLNVLFTSGFTTKTQSDEDGGRGVGLDIIKELVKEHEGKLNVKSQAKKMTRFIVSFPV